MAGHQLNLEALKGFTTEFILASESSAGRHKNLLVSLEYDANGAATARHFVNALNGIHLGPFVDLREAIDAYNQQ